MATLQQKMPPVLVDHAQLSKWGKLWLGTTGSGKSKKTKCFDKKQSMDFGKEVLDPSVAKALAKMLGDIPVVPPLNSKSLLPP